jgi:hypothetical protein
LRIAIYRKGSTDVSVFPVNNCCRQPYRKCVTPRILH